MGGAKRMEILETGEDDSFVAGAPRPRVPPEKGAEACSQLGTIHMRHSWLEPRVGVEDLHRPSKHEAPEGIEWLRELLSVHLPAGMRILGIDPLRFVPECECVDAVSERTVPHSATVDRALFQRQAGVCVRPLEIQLAIPTRERAQSDANARSSLAQDCEPLRHQSGAFRWRHWEVMELRGLG